MAERMNSLDLYEARWAAATRINEARRKVEIARHAYEEAKLELRAAALANQQLAFRSLLRNGGADG